MSTRIQVRRDTTANWETTNPTLAAGEIGYDTTKKAFKIGDGTRTWTQITYQLPYLTGDAGTTPDVTTLVVDQDNDRVGIGTSTPTEKLSVTGNATVSGNIAAGGTLSVTGNTTLTGNLSVNGGDITTTSATANVVNANATTVNIGQAATAVSIGATTGTATIRNATTAITGAATIGGTLGVTGDTTLTGDIAVNGGDITTSSGTLNVASNLTSAQTVNIATGATVSGATKALNIGTGGASGSTTNVNIGSSVAGTTAIAGAATVGGTLGVTGATTLTGALTASGGINAVTFNGDPSYASDPATNNVLTRKSYVDGKFPVINTSLGIAVLASGGTGFLNGWTVGGPGNNTATAPAGTTWVVVKWTCDVVVTLDDYSVLSTTVSTVTGGNTINLSGLNSAVSLCIRIA